MLPFRTAQMGQGLPDPTSSPDVDSRLWAEAVGRTFAERAVVGLRIPGADDYLAELAEGRAAALARHGAAVGPGGRRPRLGRAHQGPRAEAPALALPSQPQPPAPRAPDPRDEAAKGQG